MTREVLRRRFIAGARCPACDALDRVQRVEFRDGGLMLECAACGLSRDLDEQPPRQQESVAPVTWKPPRGD